jgi:AraC-like DNA-binding protein
MWSSQNFHIRPEAIPLYQLRSADDRAAEGFSSWEICYDRGYCTAEDGSRRDIAFSHRHPHFEIFWVRQGQATLSLDFESIEVRGPCLMIVGPGEVHAWQQTREITGSVVMVDAAFMAQSNFHLAFGSVALLLEQAGRRSLALNPAENALVGNFFSLIRPGADSPNFERREVLKALLLVLFNGVARLRPGPGDKFRAATLSPVTRDFQSALRSECPRLTTVKEYAGYLKVSRSFLHKSVLRDTGRPPSDLIRDRLLLEAKRLLRHTSESPAEIGRRLGFSGGGYFSAYFQSHTQRSLNDFRLQSRA